METSLSSGGEFVASSEGGAGAIAGVVDDAVAKEATTKKRVVEVVAIEKVATVKAAAEKAAADRTTADKTTIDKATTDKAVVDRAAMDRATTAKAAVDKKAAEEANARKAMAVGAVEKSVMDSADLDNTIEEPVEQPEVILGHRPIKASGDVSLLDGMGTTHFALNQVHNVLRWEREDLDEERLCLSECFSLLKKVTASEKVKAKARQKYTDVMEILLDRQQAAINELDAQA
jgi:hypothetical protein